MYTVRSVYNLAILQSLKAERCQVSGDWDSMWRSQVAPKVRNLIWRTGRGCLPTRDRLHVCYVQCPIHCSLCDAFKESEWHIFFDCPTSVACWYVAGLSHIVHNRCMRFTIAGGVLMDICARGTEEVLGRTLMVIWGVWQNGNNCVWNQTMSSTSQIVTDAHVLLA